MTNHIIIFPSKSPVAKYLCCKLEAPKVPHFRAVLFSSYKVNSIYSININIPYKLNAHYLDLFAVFKNQNFFLTEGRYKITLRTEVSLLRDF